MIDGLTVLAVIPARGGSKGLPRKNILEVGGRPLICWTIDAARKSQRLDRVIVSSDDPEILEVALRCGGEVPFQRPGELSSDTASTADVVLHALDSLPGYDVVVVLQPTSPLRTPGDIDAACDLLETTGAPACVSVSKVQQHPYWMYTMQDGQRLNPLLPDRHQYARRQDLPDVYGLNGALYVANVTWFRQNRTFVTGDTVAYVMPEDRSLDIDTAEDLWLFRRAVEGGAGD